jgi:glycosyltransferase involved in cell wall biosynthesis
MHSEMYMAWGLKKRARMLTVGTVKLVIYSHFFAPGIGGVEKQVLALASGLTREKAKEASSSEFAVTVVTNTDGKGGDDSVYPFRVVRRPSFLELWRLLRAAEVVHLAGPSLLPLAMARFLRKPTVIEHHGYQAICPNGILIHQPERSLCPGHFQAKRYGACFRCLASEMSLAASFRQLLLMFPRYLLAKHATANIAITQHVLDRHGLPASQVIYYGIEKQQSATASETPVTSGARKFRFAFVGRFVPEKGIAVLLEAVNILKIQGLPFEVRLIGDGPERKRVDAIIGKYNLAEFVRVTGYVAPGAAMASALRDVGAVIVPSVWEEAAGFSAIEQMMDGRLVIASAIGGLAEVVGDGGLLFPTGDAGALALLMKRVLLEPSLGEKIAARGRQRALGLFESDRMIREHARLYSQLVQIRN